MRVNARRVGIYKQFCRQFSDVWAHADSPQAAYAKTNEFGVGNPITKEVSNIVAPCSQGFSRQKGRVSSSVRSTRSYQPCGRNSSLCI